MTTYQIILAFISSSFLFSAIYNFITKGRNYSFFKFLSNIIIWLPIFSFSIFPDLAHLITKKLGMGENLNTLIFIGFVIIFLILFKILNKIQKIEKNITEIVRTDALRK